MSFSYKNYNVAHKLFLEAVSEFESFIPGIDATKVTAPLNSVPFGWIMKFDDDVTSEMPEEEKAARQKRSKQRRVAMQLFDRTTGMYFLNDFKRAVSSVPDVSSIVGTEYFSLVHTETTQPFGLALRGHDVSGPGSVNPGGFAKMTDVLTQAKPNLVSRKSAITPVASSGDAAADSNLETDDKKFKVDFSFMSTHKAKGAAGYQPDGILNKVPGKPNRFEAPSMGALVFKDPSMNFSAKQSSHLPVFFGAVSPLEMSRSTVYLDFRIMSTDQRHKASKINSVNFLGFPGTNDQYQMFKVNDPVGAEDDSSTLKASNSYMDVFTSPQTMVNANTNRHGLAEAAAEIIEELVDADNGSILNKFNSYGSLSTIDPMQPFMTLISADVRITGAGAALLSTKTATVNFKLHDKSRIRDLSPILSVDSFGFTKVFMEFGWSHPEGTFTSKNTVGKYLNGLRDVSTYTVKNVSYDFGADNSVDITLELASIGAAQAQAVHAGAGTHSSLRMYQDLIRRCFNVVRAGLDATADYRTNRDLRSQLFVTSRNAGSINQLVPFERMQELHTEFKNVGIAGVSPALAKDILKKLLNTLGVNGDLALANVTSETAFNKMLSSTDGELADNAARAGDLVFAKLLATTNSLDPFQVACVKNSDANDWAAGLAPAGTLAPGVIGFDGGSPRTYQQMASKSDPHVTLGKLVCQFVAQPLATCGLYDEVQVFFYPVNSHSGAARKHTTASFPISYQRVEAAFRKTLGATGSGRLKNNLDVQGAFRIFDDICADRTIPAYGIYSKDGALAEFHEFKKKEYNDKVTEAFAGLTAAGSYAGKSEADIRDILDASRGFEESYINNLAIRAYEKQLLESHTSELTSLLKKIYAPGDGYEGFSVADRFTPVNLNMFLETGPALKPAGIDAFADGALDMAISHLGYGGAGALREKLFDKGIERDKQILRIHVYDQNATQNPQLHAWFSRTSADSEVVGNAVTDEAYETLRDKPFTYWKSLVKSFYPTITHGANTGTVLNVSVSNQTGKDLSNVQLVDAFEQARGIASSQNSPSFDETIIFPGVIRLELMGNPTISRGQEIFIDFGTSTSLDNVYVVDNVSHTIKSGEFITVCDLHVANQGLVSSTRSKALSKIKAIRGSI